LRGGRDQSSRCRSWPGPRPSAPAYRRHSRHRPRWHPDRGRSVIGPFPGQHDTDLRQDRCELAANPGVPAARSPVMSGPRREFTDLLETYLSFRRAGGYGLVRAEKLLEQFGTWLHSQAAEGATNEVTSRGGCEVLFTRSQAL